MDDYYLVTIVPPPKLPPILIKTSSQVHFEKWSALGWIEGDYRNYLMGDYDYRQVSLQEAEEYMRGIAPQHWANSLHDATEVVTRKQLLGY